MRADTNRPLARIPTFVVFLLAIGAVAAAAWGQSLNIDQIGLWFGLSVIAGFVAISLATVLAARGQSGWIALTVTLALVAIAFAIWIVYAWDLGDLYDSRS
jgi:peptidoglycan/LPS O-acetylase OafA/YrhL